MVVKRKAFIYFCNPSLQASTFVTYVPFAGTKNIETSAGTGSTPLIEADLLSKPETGLALVTPD